MRMLLHKPDLFLSQRSVGDAVTQPEEDELIKEEIPPADETNGEINKGDAADEPNVVFPFSVIFEFAWNSSKSIDSNQVFFTKEPVVIEAPFSSLV